MCEALGSIPHKPGVVVRSYDPSSWKVEARSSAVQGHPQLCSEFEVNLGCMSPSSKQQQQKQQQQHTSLSLMEAVWCSL